MLLYCSTGMIDEFWNNSELYEKNLFDTMQITKGKRFLEVFSESRRTFIMELFQKYKTSYHR